MVAVVVVVHGQERVETNSVVIYTLGPCLRPPVSSKHHARGIHNLTASARRSTSFFFLFSVSFSLYLLMGAPAPVLNAASMTPPRPPPRTMFPSWVGRLTVHGRLHVTMYTEMRPLCTIQVHRGESSQIVKQIRLATGGKGLDEVGGVRRTRLC